MAFVQSDLAPAISLMEESIAIRRENDTPQTMANALLNLGTRVPHHWRYCTGN